MYDNDSNPCYVLNRNRHGNSNPRPHSPAGTFMQVRIAQILLNKTDKPLRVNACSLAHRTMQLAPLLRCAVLFGDDAAAVVQ